MAKSLYGMVGYSQKDSRWTGLALRFAQEGCAVCSAASIATYKEGKSVTPKTLQERGVFGTNSPFVNSWAAVSKEFEFLTRQYKNNITGALPEIKKQIDAGNPVMVVVEGSIQHYMVIYGYNNSCTAASDVKIIDSLGNYDNLSKALNGIYPTFLGINCIKDL